MSQHYSDPRRESDPHALPDLEVFQLTAHEVAQTMEDEIHELTKRHEFRLANMNGRSRERLLDAIVEEYGVEGGWFYQYCFPGCMPDSDPIGPFESEAEALEDARKGLEYDTED